MKNIFVKKDENKKLGFNLKLKKPILGGLGLLCCAFAFASCSNRCKDDYLQRNGTVHCNTDMKFCLDSVSGDYYSISKDAISAVNKNKVFSFSTVSGREGRNSSHFFTYESADRANAYNQVVSNRGSLNLRNDIYYNTYYMDSYNYSEKRTLALHEMGHTLGLRDIPSDKARGYSVMYESFSKGSPTFSEYPEYDRENIKWYYGWR